MRKKILIYWGMVALNAFAFSSLKSAPPAAPDAPDKWIQWLQCNCETGEIGQGMCKFGSCCTWGLNDPCDQHIPCDDPPPF